MPTPADIFGPDMAKCCCTTAPPTKTRTIIIDGLFVMGYGGQKTGDHTSDGT